MRRTVGFGPGVEEHLLGVTAERWGRALLHEWLVHGWTCWRVPHLLHLLHGGDTCTVHAIASALTQEQESQVEKKPSSNHDSREGRDVGRPRYGTLCCAYSGPPW